jgi:hypothetical protein
MKIIIGSLIGFVFALLAPQLVRAQGTNYLSNLAQASAGSLAVGSDSWWAAAFHTGTNPNGYSLNSIQLEMADASGSPGNFTVMLYAGGDWPAGFSLGSSIATLDGSLSPTTAGIYTFTTVSSLLLSPQDTYSIVITSGTAVADGAFEWSYSTNLTSATGSWGSYPFALNTDGVYVDQQHYHESPQFAINVTDAPEPGVLGLFALGGLAFLWHRRKTKAA